MVKKPIKFILVFYGITSYKSLTKKEFKYCMYITEQDLENSFERLAVECDEWKKQIENELHVEIQETSIAILEDDEKSRKMFERYKAELH